MAELTKKQIKKRDEYVDTFLKDRDDWKQRYGSRWREVMYATATDMAKKVNEVYEPFGEDEYRFWTKHIKQIFDYPVDSDENDLEKDISRSADYLDDEDEEIYESIETMDATLSRALKKNGIKFRVQTRNDESVYTIEDEKYTVVNNGKYFTLLKNKNTVKEFTNPYSLVNMLVDEMLDESLDLSKYKVITHPKNVLDAETRNITNIVRESTSRNQGLTGFDKIAPNTYLYENNVYTIEADLSSNRIVVSKVLDEQIKGWKHAASDISKMRAEKGKNVKLVSLKKDGSESDMKDAAKLFRDEKEAIETHNRIVDLNPKRNIAHNLYVDGKFVRKLDGNISEAVKIKHDRYVRSHGKKPRMSGSGNWMFTSKKMGDVDYNDTETVFQTSGKYSEASKKAKEWGKNNGHDYIYVMESTRTEYKKGDK